MRRNEGLLLSVLINQWILWCSPQKQEACYLYEKNLETCNNCKVMRSMCEKVKGGKQCKGSGVGVIGRREAVTATLSAMSAMSKVVRKV